MKKVLMLVLSGFGCRDEANGNAIKHANMHVYEDFKSKYPNTTLFASEERLGLLPGQSSGSENSYMALGSGRRVKSCSEKVELFLKDFDDSNESVIKLKSMSSRKCHIMGLCSDGNIHCNVETIIKIYNKLISFGFKKIYFHLITDGRDVKIDSASSYIKMISDEIAKREIGSIATVCGRYYAMDCDLNYDRTKKYYDLVTSGIGTDIINIDSALSSCYDKNITDEFIPPFLIDNSGIIKNGDVVIWANYRPERSRQILSAICTSEFNSFAVKSFDDLEMFTFFSLDKTIKTSVFIPNEDINNSLGVYLSKLGLKQARIAESEKINHITYFFDCLYYGKLDNCDKYIVPSPKVSTYDLIPEMNVVGVTKKIIECMDKDYDFILADYANIDMVGHTGNFDATVKACSAVDICLSKVIEAAEDNFYTIFLLSDHGNADFMQNDDGSVCTTHSLSKVPFIVSDSKIKLLDNGDITMIAPTLLDYMDISIPLQMTSESLIEKNN